MFTLNFIFQELGGGGFANTKAMTKLLEILGKTAFLIEKIIEIVEEFVKVFYLI